MNPNLKYLQPYPFQRLASLKQGIKPAVDEHISLSIGEPKHPTPQIIHDALVANLEGLATYPSTRGIVELRESIRQWLTRRFVIRPELLDVEKHILPVNGTREALFAFAQAVVDPAGKPLVMMPNPFYQIYEGAALLAAAEPFFMNCLPENGYLPDLDAVSDSTWQRCQLIYICSPGNPSGAVMPAEQMQKLLELSDRYDFVIASDECYSEIYFDDATPPAGMLEVCQQMGRDDFKNVVVFHSLSKRSNAPGLRSGFVAGDANIIEQFFQYRTYHGCAMSVTAQHASIAAWNDELHVTDNRIQYQHKFDQVIDILRDSLPVSKPEASFYLWIPTPGSDEVFARELFASQNVTVLPGSYLSRTAAGINPGQNHVRLALVASNEECLLAAQRIKLFCENL
jgi:N-succinyldiaminopimelate aminotransferase